MIKRIVVITLMFIFVVLILRNPSKIIKLTEIINQQFSKMWLSLVNV